MEIWCQGWKVRGRRHTIAGCGDLFPLGNGIHVRSPWSPGVILLGAKRPAFKVELSVSMYYVLYTSQFEINYPSSTSFQPSLTQSLPRT